MLKKIMEYYILLGLPVSRPVDSGIHLHILLTAYKRGVNTSVIRAIRDRHKKLNGRAKVTVSPCTVEFTASIPLKKVLDRVLLLLSHRRKF